MDRRAYAKGERPGTFAPPRFRTFILTTSALFVLAFAILAANLGDAPAAQASHTPTQYNLCHRTLSASGFIISHLRTWGRDNSDDRYDVDQRFGCGNYDHDSDPDTPSVRLSAIISAADLLAHTDWTTHNGRLVIGERGLNATELRAGDFAGLNATVFDFNNSRLTTLPAGLFEGLRIQQMTIWGNQRLRSLDKDVFKGIVGTGSTGQGMGFTFMLNPNITEDSLPPTVFDPLGNSGEAPSNNLRDKDGIQGLSFRRNGVSQLNTRWFAHFRHMGVTYDWGSINLADSSSTLKTEFWDSYYYDDGTGEYTDPTKSTRGVNSITSSTTKADIAAAIKAAIDSVGDASDTKADFTTGTTLQVTTGNFGSIDICDRTPAVRDEIIKEMRAEQSAIYGSVSGSTITDGSYGPFGCSAGRTAIVTKGNLTSHTNWDTDAAGMNLDNKGLTELRQHDFRYLDMQYLTFGRNNIPELPDDIFSGLPLRTLRMNRIGITKLQSGLFRGIDASNFQILGLADNENLSDVNIAPDVFDPLTDLRFLALDGGEIGRVNTRWFKKLSKLGDGAGWHGINLTENPVVAYYSNNTGGYHDTGATNKVAYDPLDSDDQDALRTAIIAAIDMPRPDLELTSAKFDAPDEHGIDPCDRNEVVWKELMRQYGHIPDDDDLPISIYPNTYPTPTEYQVGDVRFERYANITLSQCRVLRAQWVHQPSGLVSDQSSPNAATDVLSFTPAPPYRRLVDHLTDGERAFNLSGADLSRLTPADLANMHAFESLDLSNANLESPNQSLFAHMPHLTVLNLAGNKLRTADLNRSPNFLTPLRKLEDLNLNDNLLTTFDGDWVPAAARSTLEVLLLEGNPMTKTDLARLDVRVLSISRSSITELDSAITDMTNLEELYWSDLRALPLDGIDRFIQNLPDSITRSEAGDRIGNPGDLDSSELDAATIGLQLAHLAKVRENTFEPLHLSDACRPPIHSVKPVLRRTHHEAWEENFGNLCLTDAQRNALINELDDYGKVYEIELINLNLSDTQMANLFSEIHELLEGLNWGIWPIYRDLTTLRLVGNPNAFGDGFDNSVLDGFDGQRDITELTISHSDLNFAQANTILRGLEAAYVPLFQSSDRQPGLHTLDLSFNNRLFTDVDADTATPFLRGIMRVRREAAPAVCALESCLERGIMRFRRDAPPVEINLRSTDLSFDILKAMLDGMDGGDRFVGSFRAGEAGDLRRLRTLDLSYNANLWKRKNQSDEWVDVPAAEINELLARLPGLTTLRVGGTGITTQTMLQTVFNALDHSPSTYRHLDARDTSTLDRLQGLDLSSNNLRDLTAAELEAEFAKMGTGDSLQFPQFRTLGLGYTQITLPQLTGIVDGLESAGLLDGIFDLDLSGNINLLSCPTEGVNDPLSILLARFTNLRHLDVSDTASGIETLQCIVHGLNSGDGNTRDGLASNLISLNLRDNPQMFDAPEREQRTGKADSAQVAEILAPLRNTRVNLAETEITPAQLFAVLQARLAGQSEDERRQTQRSFAGQNAALAFKTPLPDNTRLLGGRGSLRVSFTHNPMVDGSAFDVLRYEYRYRVRPENADDAWGNSGTEAWTDAPVDLTNTGDKAFDIYDLAVETVYQLQLRAVSLALPNVRTLTGGTTVDLPKISAIKPGITEVNIRSGEQIRLEVDIFGMNDKVNNAIPDRDGVNLIFAWNDDAGGGSFADPNDRRRVTYTASNLPGTYLVTAEAGPDGICRSHHESEFGISDADRAPCIATFTVRVSRAPTPPTAQDDPVNPTGTIPTSLSDTDGAAYDVFTPVEGGTFDGEGISVTAAKGAVPDRQLIGVNATMSTYAAPQPVPGATMTISGRLYDIRGVNASGQQLSGFQLDAPLSACLPLPDAFRANLTNIVLVERKVDASYAILTSSLRQTGGELAVCGQVSTLPATVGVAKLGVIPELPPTPTPEIETPDTGAAAPSYRLIILALLLGALILTGIYRIRRIHMFNP